MQVSGGLGRDAGRASHALAAAQPLNADYEAKLKKKKEAEAKGLPPVFVELDPFTVNLADKESERYAQIGLTLEIDDAKTGEDLTRAILLQIILEEETGGVQFFSERMLADIIRFYGHSMQGFMGSYLEQSVEAFADLQRQMADQAKGLTPEMWSQFLGVQPPLIPGVALGGYLEQSQKALNQLQQQMLEAFGVKR